MSIVEPLKILVNEANEVHLDKIGELCRKHKVPSKSNSKKEGLIITFRFETVEKRDLFETDIRKTIPKLFD